MTPQHNSDHVSALTVFSCHSEAAAIKRNWDSSSASYASRPQQVVVFCTKMAQVCKLFDDIEILTHFAIWQESMLDCRFFLFVNYDIDDSESVETRDSMHVPRPTKQARLAEAVLSPRVGFPFEPHACSFPLTPASRQAPALTSLLRPVACKTTTLCRSKPASGLDVGKHVAFWRFGVLGLI